MQLKWQQIIASIAATLGSLGWGCSIGWPAVALPKLMQNDTNNIYVEAEEASWVGSSMPVGGAMGGLSTGLLVDRFGRKRIMQILYILMALGWVVISTGQTVAVLCVGRVITGYTSAAFALAGPVYIGEVTNAQLRGPLSSCVSFMVSIGLLYVLVAGSLLNPAMSALACVPWCVLGFLFLLGVPESPHYLYTCRQFSSASAATTWLHGKDKADMEYQQIVQQGKAAQGSPTRRIHGKGKAGSEYDDIRNGKGKADTDYDEILHGKDKADNDYDEILNGKDKEYDEITQEDPTSSGSNEPLWDTYSWSMLAIMCSVMIFSRLTGIPAVSYYTVEIFLSAKISLDPNIATILCGVTELVGGGMSLILTDRAGRKVLLLVSSVGMSLSMFSMASMFELKANNNQAVDVISVCMVGSIIIFYLSFAIGFAPIPMVLLGEVFPLRIKGVATTVCMTVLWAFSFLVSKSFFSLRELLGNSATFGCFACFNAVAAIFVVFFIPETRGKTLLEIQQTYRVKAVNDQQTYRVKAVNSQQTYRVKAGNSQQTYRVKAVNSHLVEQNSNDALDKL